MGDQTTTPVSRRRNNWVALVAVCQESTISALLILLQQTDNAALVREAHDAFCGSETKRQSGLLSGPLGKRNPPYSAPSADEVGLPSELEFRSRFHGLHRGGARLALIDSQPGASLRWTNRRRVGPRVKRRRPYRH